MTSAQSAQSTGCTPCTLTPCSSPRRVKRTLPTVGCTPCTIKQNGYTLIELLIALAVSALLFAGLGSVLGQVLDTRADVHEKNDLTRQARFAMQQMVRAVSRSPRLLLPLDDNPNTNWPEHIREQTIPASPPIGDSTLATAVLVVTLDPTIDLDGDGTPDADNDGDGRFDEDLPGDNSFDFAPGIFNIDDDGDGQVDVSAAVSRLKTTTRMTSTLMTPSTASITTAMAALTRILGLMRTAMDARVVARSMTMRMAYLTRSISSTMTRTGK